MGDTVEEVSKEPRRRATDRREDELLRRLTRLEEGGMATDKTVARLELLVQNSMTLVERFENTLDRTATALFELNSTIIQINQKVGQNSLDIKEVEGNVVQVKEKLKIIDDKGKIDFLQLVKDNFAKYILGGGFLVGLAVWIDHLLDTWLALKK